MVANVVLVAISSFCEVLRDVHVLTDDTSGVLVRHSDCMICTRVSLIKLYLSCTLIRDSVVAGEMRPSRGVLRFDEDNAESASFVFSSTPPVLSFYLKHVGVPAKFRGPGVVPGRVIDDACSEKAFRPLRTAVHTYT
jgi:hypothetical protein